MLGRLAASIEAIERRPALTSAAESAAAGSRHSGWSFGTDEIDSWLAPQGIETQALHEIKPAMTEDGGWAGDWAGALGFTLALAIRRLASRPARPRPAVLWCWPASLSAEIGGLYGPGLAGLGLDPGFVVLVTPSRPAEVLWALEEGLRASSLALVVGVLDEVGLTPARRLSLAAETHHTPCLLVTARRSAATAATASRWRAGRLASAPHPFDPRAPGLSRWQVALERSRRHGLAALSTPLALEWSHEALRFDLVARSGDRSDAAGRARQHFR